MANEETVTKVVEGVDELFDQIVVNGQTVRDARPRARMTSRPSSTSSNPRSSTPIQGEYVKAVQLNNVLHDLKDEPLTQVVSEIDSTLTDVQGDVSDLQGDVSTLQNAVDTISSKIPSTASSSNKLTDKNYVDTEISDAVNDLDVAEVGGTGKYIKSIKQENGKIVAVDDYLSSTGGGVAFIGTRAEYEVAKLIPLGQTGHIPSGSKIIITDENAYIKGEEQ